ncbi:MAG TPA: class I SAM-dependent methyltransferase [Polyangia bacterium]|jgi:ubiquinone/menaquinone biosynthesis C-methylase UbiE|nr:class I SAM-dependent methyltransferase [Polyangia bacterium]
MRLREPWPAARSRQRRREFATLFGGVPRGGLGRTLEVGGGDGFFASLLLAQCGSLLSTDRYPREHASESTGVKRLTCDATQLPFTDGAFDFVVSSNVLAHIRERSLACREMTRCLGTGGLMIHITPSRTWKLLQLLFYYPHVLMGAIDLLLDFVFGRIRRPDRKLHERWSDTRLPSLRRIVTGLLPTIQGEYSGHLAEWRGFGVSAWRRQFETAGLEVCRVAALPLYSGYGFGFERLRRIGERLGLSAHHAFILARRGERPATLRWFAEPGGT